MIHHEQLNGIDISTFKAAKKGNWCSGDSLLIEKTEDYVVCAVADGLGSGEEAAEASEAAIETIKENHHLDVESLMAKCNNVLFNKRGAVLAILKIDINDCQITYSNVGNIGCIFYDPSGKLTRPIPSRGYLSGKKQDFRIQKIYLEQEMSFILYTDGLIFNPVYHSYFTKMNSTKTTIQHLVDLNMDFKDDTTIVVGKINL
ncbi:negative regulator of sigma-B (phosphoserine phosphatase) [Evansella vedderi]|uniref:Negative regulator of sigma-B (Phosphoserine phosphatase) n=1 Tax=Evansella vedderi TaxID=38282 RepID=A0ABT9ZY32_9BACI|nr:SpoIIE family protein phosphatase [Evansella vedderi]MDQ0256144.1 negative regulator of sigma-B (phosphoserine phosphatase) [Evansella vedderi]